MERKGKLEIGRKFLKVVSIGFLGIGLIIACLNCFGMCPSRSDWLIMLSMAGSMSSIHSFNRPVVASMVGGIPELLNNHELDWLYQAQDERDLKKTKDREIER